MHLRALPYSSSKPARFGMYLESCRDARSAAAAVQRSQEQGTASRLNGLLAAFEDMSCHLADLDDTVNVDMNELPGEIAVARVQMPERFGNETEPVVDAFLALKGGTILEADLVLGSKPLLRMHAAGGAPPCIELYSPQDDSYYMLTPADGQLYEVTRRGASADS
jgi:hypothetical protein